MAHYTFAQFTREVEAVVRCQGQPEVLVSRIQPLLSQLLERRDWLDDRYRRPVSGKSYSQYLLYTPPDEAWSVVSFVWPGGATTPVHDHDTWGVIGVYQGQERETRYAIVEGSIAAHRVRLVETATATMHPEKWARSSHPMISIASRTTATKWRSRYMCMARTSASRNGTSSTSPPAK